MSDVLMLMLGLVGQWCLGASIALLILGRRALAGSSRVTGFFVRRAELLGLGFTLGIAVNSLLLFLWSFAGGSLSQGNSVTLAVGSIVLFVTLTIFNRRTAHDTGLLQPPDTGQAMSRGCLFVIVLLFAVAVIQALLTPQKFWDERAFYGLKAIVLFEDRTIHSADLAHPDFVQGHPRYPLLISLAEQHLYALLGRVDDRLSKVIFPTLYLGLVLAFAGMLMRHHSAGQAWLAALILATVPVLMPDDYGFICGQADAPTACYEGLTIFYLWDSLASWQHHRTASWSRSLILASLLTACTAFTKDEGIAFAMIHAVAFGLAMISVSFWSMSAEGSKPSSSWRVLLFGILALVVIPAVVLGPWFSHRRQLPLTGEMNYFGRLSPLAVWNGLSTLSWSVPHLLNRMFGEATIWGLQWWFALLSLVLFPKRLFQASQLFLLLTLAGALAALLLAGMLAPVMLEEHIGGSSHRYLMQLAPLAILLAFSQLSDRDVAGETI